MRFHKFDMNLLVVLDALLTEKNITMAGEKIFLSQSATSGALARLREYFDDQLLVQVGRKMLLTPLAESLVKPVHDLLLQTQSTLEIKPTFSPKESNRHITCIMSDYTATIVMPDVIRHVNQLAPGISFEVLSTDNSPVEEMEHGNADFLLMPERFHSSNHPYVELFDEEFVCICCKNNPDISNSISSKDFFSMGHVTAQFGSSKRPTLDSIFLNEIKKERKIEVIVSSFNMIPISVAGTNRIAIIQKRLAQYWEKIIPIKILPCPIQIPKITWILQWHQYRAYDPCTLWLKDIILSTAKSKCVSNKMPQ